MNIKHFLLYYHTIKYLKPIQIRYRIYYFLRKKIRSITGFKYNDAPDVRLRQLNGYKDVIFNHRSYYEKNTFIFLNQKKEFTGKIDWNFSGYGKLWTYNLNYFEFLNQKDITVNEGLRLINDYIDNFSSIKDGLEAYPVSLRIVNWIKFLLKNNIRDEKIIKNLYTQVSILKDNLEYHLLGNHLLENAFALTIAGIYFDDDKLLSDAKSLLQEQLTEQILADGAHFELSPMYHHILLYRLFDLINIWNTAGIEDGNFKEFLYKKASDMLAWSSNMTFGNGDFPYFNDSANEISVTPLQIEEYARFLRVKPAKIELNESGYRYYNSDKYELILDAGKIGPDYIPGHAHCDIFSFVLIINNKPIIVDTGISVYGGNSAKRYYERSTEAHNTVKVGNMQQVEIWGDYRVGRRSVPVILSEDDKSIEIQYRHFSGKYFHYRKFEFVENKIIIIDKISSDAEAFGFLHFDANCDIELKGKQIIFDKGKITVDNAVVQIDEYPQTLAFNKIIKAKKVKMAFYREMKIIIQL